MWTKRRGLLKDVGPTQPPGGRNKPSRPRKKGVGVAEAAQDEDQEPHAAGRRYEQRRQRGGNGIRYLKGQK